LKDITTLSYNLPLLRRGKDCGHIFFVDLPALHLLSGMVGDAIFDNSFAACHMP